MKIIFMGTPEFAVPSLNALIDSPHEVLAAVTQPDKPKGRNNKITPSPIKETALAHGIKVLQYSRIRDEGVAGLKELSPDIMITAAYGQILTREILDIPRYGVINVHASLLPKYRGAMPVQWAVINGEKTTGITIMQTDPGLDSGDILLRSEIAINDGDTAGDILARLSCLGAKELIKALDLIEKGKITPVKQIPEDATYFPIIKKEHCLIGWNKTAYEINNLIRGLNPAPAAFTMLDGKVMKVWKAEIRPEIYGGAESGEIIRSDKGGLWVKCGGGVLSLIEIQMPNSNRMTAVSYLNGRKIPLGTVLK